MTVNVIKKILLIVVLSRGCFSAGIRLSAQGTTYNYFYRVYFKDKGDLNPNNFSPENLLSQKANNRRQKVRINALVFSDLQNNHQGVYFITLITSDGTFSHKVIKLNN